MSPAGLQPKWKGFAALRNYRHKHAVGCTLEEEMQIGQFARFTQNYAVPLSDFVRKQLAGFTALVLVSRFDAPKASRII